MYSADWGSNAPIEQHLPSSTGEILAIEQEGHQIPLEVEFQSLGWCMAGNRTLTGTILTRAEISTGNTTTPEQSIKLPPEIAIFPQMWLSQSSVAWNLLIPYKAQAMLQVAVR